MLNKISEFIQKIWNLLNDISIIKNLLENQDRKIGWTERILYALVIFWPMFILCFLICIHIWLINESILSFFIKDHQEFLSFFIAYNDKIVITCSSVVLWFILSSYITLDSKQLKDSRQGIKTLVLAIIFLIYIGFGFWFYFTLNKSITNTEESNVQVTLSGTLMEIKAMRSELNSLKTELSKNSLSWKK